MDEPLRVSYSSVQDWRTCEQLYWYRYVKRLKPRVRQAAPELGTVLHEYLELFYKTKKHKAALKTAIADHEPELRAYASTAESLGVEDAAKALLAITPTASALATAYYRVHGAADLEEHEVVLVEQDFEMEVRPGIILPGKIDLVTKNKQGYWLWEHKTTGNVPTNGRRFRDLQTLIYNAALEELYDIKVTGVVWNYIHTARPHEPPLLQSGTLSQAKNQVTTLELYKAAVKREGLDPYKYDVTMRQIERRERQTMFPRFTLPLMQEEHILLSDYMRSARAVKRARENPKFKPVRTIGPQCDWCSMVKLCQAALLGSDEDVTARKHFTIEERGTKHGKR